MSQQGRAAAAPGEASGMAMPALFIGHGHPMNAIQTNEFTQSLARIGAGLPRPAAILVVSAHWLTYSAAAVSSTAQPATVYDFGNFAPDLFRVVYAAPGAPALAALVRETVRAVKLRDDTRRGLDHGAWTILKHIYPHADIPVFQLSIDFAKTAPYHYALGRELSFLRQRGVLVVGSGNIVHNLSRITWDDVDGRTEDWAKEFDALVKQYLLAGNHRALVDYEKLGAGADISIPTCDHYLPMLYVLGLQGDKDPITFVHEGFQYANLSMRCFQVG